MGMPAATIGVTHSFEVVAEAEVATTICFRGADSIIGCCFDCAADAETWGHLQVGGRPWVLRLGGGLTFTVAPSWWGCGWGQGGGGVSACWWVPQSGRLGGEGPW